MKKTIPYFISAQLAFGSFVTTPVYAGVSDKLKKSDISGSVRILDSELLKGFDIGLSIATDIKNTNNPLLTDKYGNQINSIKVDSYKLKGNLNWAQILFNRLTPIYFDTGAKANVHHVRLYNKQSEALKTIASGFKELIDKLPKNADEVLNQMGEKEMFSIPIRLNVEVGFGTGKETPVSHIQTDTRYTKFASSEFILQIYKLTATDARVRIIANSSDGRKARTGVDFIYDLDGSIWEDALAHLYDKTLIKFEDIKVTSNHKFVLDYIFDLSHPEAKEAYNALIQPKEIIKGRVLEDKMKNKLNHQQFKKFSDIQRVARTSLADAVSQKYSALTLSEKPPVRRLFKGLFDTTSTSNLNEIGIILASKSSLKTTSQVDLTSYDLNDDTNRFRSGKNEEYKRNRLGRRVINIQEKIRTSFFSVSPVEENNNTDLGLGFTYLNSDDKLSKRELKISRSIFDAQIPDTFKRVIPTANEWIDKNSKKKNAFIDATLFLNNKGLTRIQEISQQLTEPEFKRLFKNYYDQFKKQRYNLISSFFKFLHTAFTHPIQTVTFSVKENMAKNLWTCLNEECRGLFPKLSKEENQVYGWGKIARLHDDVQEMGLGFLLSLLEMELKQELQNISNPEEQLALIESYFNEYLYLDIILKAEGTNKIAYQFGKLENAKALYELNLESSKTDTDDDDIELLVEQQMVLLKDDTKPKKSPKPKT